MFDEINRYKINLYLNGEITICSNHRRNTENIVRNSSTQRTGYSIKKSTRRNLVSSAFFLFLKKQHNIVFLTLTFPYKVKKGEKINPALNRFLTNLRKNYGLKNYIWTREDTKKGNPHFHILADIPFVPITKINNAWSKAINNYSPNCVRLPDKSKSIVSDIERTCKYVSKYITKDQKYKFPERCYSISSEIKVKPIRLSYADFRTIDYDHKKDMKYRVFDHCTTVQIWDFFKKSDYFISFLADYTETTEIREKGRESVNPIESYEREAQEGLPLQYSLFDSS